MNRRIKKKIERKFLRYKAYAIYGTQLNSYQSIKFWKKLIRALNRQLETHLDLPYNIKLQKRRRNRRHAVDIVCHRTMSSLVKFIKEEE